MIENKKDERLASVKDYKRVPLAKQLPLDTPFGITILTNSTCNLRCEFCIYTSKHMERNVYKKDMTMDIFTKLIDELKLFPKKIKALHFCPCGEPLLCKDIVKMIKYAKQSDVAEKIDIITNGVLLTPTMSDALVDAGIDWIRISLDGLSSEDFKKYCDRNVDFDAFVENLTYLFNNRKDTKIYLKIMDYMLDTQEKKDYFHKTFEPITDMLSVEFLQNHHDAKKKIDDKKGSMFKQDDIEKNVCSVPFCNAYIMPNGDVMPCAYLKYVITNDMKPFGNIKETSLFDIWNGKKLNDFKYNMLCGTKKIGFPCSECNGPSTITHPEDNLDNDAERLKKFFEVKND